MKLEEAKRRLPRRYMDGVTREGERDRNKGKES